MQHTVTPVINTPVINIDEFVTVLRTARHQHGLKPAQLAAAVGVSSATVRSWESRRRTPSRAAAIRWAAALGGADWIAGLDTAGWFTRSTMRRVAECGTTSGRNAHIYRKEPVCADCAAAQRDYRASRRAEIRADAQSR